ncbi:hypothetical protein ABPG74_013909 [Tetrahymena malaccensis]
MSINQSQNSQQDISQGISTAASTNALIENIPPPVSQRGHANNNSSSQGSTLDKIHQILLKQIQESQAAREQQNQQIQSILNDNKEQRNDNKEQRRVTQNILEDNKEQRRETQKILNDYLNESKEHRKMLYYLATLSLGFFIYKTYKTG